MWAVTYSYVTEASAREGDTAEDGFLVPSGSLRDSIDVFLSFPWDYIEANEYPVGEGVEWFTAYPQNGYVNDDPSIISETRSLHIPEHISGPSRIRLARLLGVKGVK